MAKGLLIRVGSFTFEPNTAYCGVGLNSSMIPQAFDVSPSGGL
jgi:hypothetical protein